MTINYLTLNNTNLIGVLIVINLLYKPFTIGLIYYILYIVRFNTKVTIIEFLLTIALIYQISFFIEISINSLTYYSSISDHIVYMSDNNNNNNNNNIPNDNIPRNMNNTDYARLIRYLSSNVAALTLRRPITRLIGLTIANAGNILADIASNEERANYWLGTFNLALDQYNFYSRNGRFRGGQDFTGPFERGTNPFENGGNTGNSNNSENTSNLISNFDFIKDFLSPVDHSIPIDTLINVHFIMILGLLVLTLSVLIITIYFYINLIILFNKDYFLNKVKNKYVLLYVKYVAFKTRIDIIVISIIILVVLSYMVYILHYLVVHPIIIK